MGRPKTRHEFDERIEGALVNKLIVQEYGFHKTTSTAGNQDFETYVDLLDGGRPEKEYDWMSDISLGDFFSHVATQSSLDVSQYFQTREFIECYVEDPSEQSLKAASANKELINRTLNRRTLFHFFKFIRARLINSLGGNVWAECWWEQKTKEDVIGIKRSVKELDVDILGEPIISEEQIPGVTFEEENVMGKVPVIDQFNYEILDPRNVVTNNKYVYTGQDKDFVWVRRRKSLEELKQDADVEGYFNLHLLKEAKPIAQTETSKEVEDKDSGQQASYDYADQNFFDIYKRYGKFWAIVQEESEDGYPIKVKPGIDANGKVKKDASLIELIMSFAKVGENKVLIAFHPTPYRDWKGSPFKPIIRGLCYVHPTKDTGMGDGQFARELQKAIDDTFNVSSDRTMLATMPTFKGKRYVTEDNNTAYMEPEHIIECEDPEKDLIEIEISTDTQAALNQINILSSKMDQVMAVYPTTMGDLPGRASTTATAVVGAEGKTSIRTNYKSMTFEHTFLSELYWMITQMTYRFAYPQTGTELMGEKVIDFNPSLEYTYKPLSQSIESEQSKMAKIRMWQQVGQMIVQLQHPDTVVMLNYVFGKICELMGDEYVNFAEAFLGTDVPIQGGQGAGGSAAGDMGMQGKPTNQYQIPMSPTEMGAREMGGGV